ncbi:general substrate transporter [Papiliotrema laurentii]|uniref:General substrate transporter n=1 Tax=Papiliotrema laurentii TaxID=5418 RepID=A0AAD9CX77_PAPLA|nr:general substrate transporter [Papiliotrema laurentii]
MSSHIDQLLAGRKTSYWGTRGLLALNLMLILPQLSSYATGYDGSMMNGLQSLDTWQSYFNHPTGSILGLFNCIQPVGQILSFPVEAWFSDKYGRRFGMFVGAAILLVGTILQGAAQNMGMFVAARGIIGFGLGINITAAPVYILETAFPTHRSPLTAVYNALWNVGSLVAAWVTYGTFTMGNNWAWRIPSLLQALASVLQILLIYALPESPRWLVENGKTEEAARVLTKYHAGGNPNDPLIELELAEIHMAIETDKEINETTSYLTLFRNKANRSRTLIIIAIGFFSQWSGNGLISYYLSLILSSVGYTSSQDQLMINGVLQAFSLVTAIGGALVVNRFKRRTLWLTSTVGIFVVFIVWTICESLYEKSNNAGNPNVAAGKAVVAMIFIYQFFSNVGWVPLQVLYCIEILPLAIRARGLAVYNLSVSLAGFVNQYLNPVGIQNLGWKYYIVYDVWIFFELVIVFFFFKETQGMSLEGTAALYDGALAVEGIAASGAAATEKARGVEDVEEKEQGRPQVTVLEA